MSDEQQDTKEMRKVQAQREEQEQQLAETAIDEHEAALHERRAEKANYLREKLEERAESERKAADEADAG
jgi:hypothetical protein